MQTKRIELVHIAEAPYKSMTTHVPHAKNPFTQATSSSPLKMPLNKLPKFFIFGFLMETPLMLTAAFMYVCPSSRVNGKWGFNCWVNIF